VKNIFTILLLIISFIYSLNLSARTIDADAIRSSDRTKTWTMPAVTGTLLNAGSISGATKTKITYGATGLVTSGADAALTDLSGVVISTPTSGQVLSYNGTNWVNSASSGASVITNYGNQTALGSAEVLANGSVVHSNGTWISSVSHGGTGYYTVNFSTNFFNAAPACTCTGTDGGSRNDTICNTPASTYSSSAVTVYLYEGTSAIDVSFTIICVGTHN
jgi:hypothetical protein